MSAEEPIRSFEEFWPHYVRAHSNPGNRMLHFAGTTAAVACLAAGILTRKPKLALLAPVVGYGAAWIGHFGVEKNKPATFGHPLWSLASDFIMWWKILNGSMDAEVERHTAAAAAAAPAAPPPQEDAAKSGSPDRYAIN
ncbi:MAG: DUF962 domain-containing protein [Polyangiaceae bacterium]|nr:DUF962 domain-containing protein [Polyangiaceae bacterium]